MVGEVEVAVPREDEAVRALEALAVAPGERRRHPPGREVERQDALLVVRHAEARAVRVRRQPVRLPVVLGGRGPCPDRRDAEHPAMRDVGDVEVACPVEARPFQEAMHGLVGAAWRKPGPMIGPRGQ
jgi:hypothetical protein